MSPLRARNAKSHARTTYVGEKESLEALMHGIFAITMTLLILDLRLPDYEQGELWASLRQLGPELAGYAFGFVYLMSVWLSLRNFMRQLTGVTRLVSIVFLLVVGLVSLTPFTVSTLATAIGNDHDLGTAVRLMAVVVGVAYLLSGCMSKFARRQELVPATPLFTTSWPRVVLLTTGPAILGFAFSYLDPWVGLGVLSTDMVLNIVVTEQPQAHLPAT